MKRLLVIAFGLAACLVWADTKWRNGNTTDLGFVTTVNCVKDGGLLCTRDAGSIGDIRCMNATATETGCVTPGDQTWAGKKALSDRAQLVCKAHASLTACAAGEKGTWQSCCTHNAPVYCNGTTNIELTGAGSLWTLSPIYVNGLLHSGLFVIGTFTLPYQFTVTQVSGFIAAGTGAGSMNIRYSDGSSFCDCAVDCDSDSSAVTCTGNCTYAASSLIIVQINSDTCSSPPTVKGLLTTAGYKL